MLHSRPTLRVLIGLLTPLALVPGKADGQEPPAWAKSDAGVVTQDGERVVFGVGQGTASADQSAAEAAASVARKRISRVLFDVTSKSAPAAGTGFDGMFADMKHTETKLAIARAVVTGVGVSGVWQSADGQTGYALASAPAGALLAALDSAALDDQSRAKLKAGVEEELATLESKTTLKPHEVPRPAAADFGGKSGTPPAWTRYGCGAYTKGEDKIWFGVGLVSEMARADMARGAAENRARAEIAKCVSFTVEKTASGTRITSNVTLWGAAITGHYTDPEGTVYALAEVPESLLPGADERRAAVEESLKPTPVAEAPAAPPAPAALRKCSGSAQRGDKLNIALGVIGAEADLLKGRLATELTSRGFKVLDDTDMTTRAHGQLVMNVRGAYVDKGLKDCIIEVEFLRGTTTLNKGTYGCALRQDRDKPLDLSMAELNDYADLLKCSIADNLGLAARPTKGKK